MLLALDGGLWLGVGQQIGPSLRWAILTRPFTDKNSSPPSPTFQRWVPSTPHFLLLYSTILTILFAFSNFLDYLHHQHDWLVSQDEGSLDSITHPNNKCSSHFLTCQDVPYTSGGEVVPYQIVPKPNYVDQHCTNQRVGHGWSNITQPCQMWTSL